MPPPAGKWIILFLVIAGMGAIMSFHSFRGGNPDEKDYSKCLKKYNSEWGEPCTQCTSFNNSYRVSLRNTCTETIDVKCAVQESDKRWKTFIKLSMAGGDTMVAYACNGLGKYMVWARKSGDRINEFPSDEEINAQNKK